MTGVSGSRRSSTSNNHDNFHHMHRQQQQIERIKREIQIRAVIADDDLDFDIEDDDKDHVDEECGDSNEFENVSLCGRRKQGCNSTDLSLLTLPSDDSYAPLQLGKAGKPKIFACY